VGAKGNAYSPTRLGERMEEFNPRDVRRFLLGRYEFRYEIQDKTI